MRHAPGAQCLEPIEQLAAAATQHGPKSKTQTHAQANPRATATDGHGRWRCCRLPWAFCAQVTRTKSLWESFEKHRSWLLVLVSKRTECICAVFLLGLCPAFAFEIKAAVRHDATLGSRTNWANRLWSCDLHLRPPPLLPSTASCCRSYKLRGWSAHLSAGSYSCCSFRYGPRNRLHRLP
jgi:hypothetical protein